MQIKIFSARTENKQQGYVELNKALRSEKQEAEVSGNWFQQDSDSQTPVRMICK